MATPEIIIVDIASTYLDPENIREDWSSADAQAELEALALSLRDNGNKDMCKARPHATIPGAWEIYDGNRRRTAMGWLHERGEAIKGYPLGKMPLVIGMAESDEAKLVDGLIANSARRNLNDWEECKGYCKILLTGVPFEERGATVYVALTEAELSRIVSASDLDADGLKTALGTWVAHRGLGTPPTIYAVLVRLAKAVASKSVKYVVKRIGFRRLIPDAQEQIRKGQLGVAFAEALLPLDANCQHKALTLLQTRDMSKTEFVCLCKQLSDAQTEDAQTSMLDFWNEQLVIEGAKVVAKRKLVTGLRRREELADILPPRNMGSVNDALAYMLAEAKKKGVADDILLTMETMQDALLRSYWTS